MLVYGDLAAGVDAAVPYADCGCTSSASALMTADVLGVDAVAVVEVHLAGVLGLVQDD
jgi:hypothetical protein